MQEETVSNILKEFEQMDEKIEISKESKINQGKKK